MLKKIISYFVLSYLCQNYLLFSQQTDIQINKNITEKVWDAKWITHTNGNFNLNGQGVYYFRKNFIVLEKYENFIIHVSADNRYKIFVNGKYIGNGPARSDVKHWQFDTYNIAQYLQKGENIIAALVWNWGDNGPWAQMKYRTAFILQGNSENEKIINTNCSWKVIQDNSYSFLKPDTKFFPQTTGVGGTEMIDGSKYLWNWEKLDYNDENWISSTELNNGIPVGINPDSFEWQLIPRQIPFMEEKEQRITQLVRKTGGDISDDFLQGKDVIIPANSSVKILLDQQYETTAYPQLEVSGGKKAEIKVIYSESLFDKDMNEVNRNLIGDYQARGLYDIFITDGGQHRKFKTLWFRTYRFIQLEIQTKDEPLIINDFKGYFTAYPFELKAEFQSNDTVLNKIFNMGWRTARLCAQENYIDCPYYEQLQYFGDFNISNPVTVLLSGDAKLTRNAILQGDYSRQSGALTMCAYPSKETGKIIPSFAISWIDVVYNYIFYTGDIEFGNKMKKSVEGIFQWYENQLNKDNMLGSMPFWNFVDCTSDWKWDPKNGSICEPPGTKEGYSAILTLQYIYGLEKGIELMNLLGDKAKAEIYSQLVEKVKKATYDLCWDEKRQYIADTPEKSSYSQHANVFAVLTGVIDKNKASDLLLKTMNDKDIIQMSLQFRAYFHKALVKCNIQNEYLKYIYPWKKMIDWGFTTFPEYPDLNTRSDCHAWNSFPSYELLNIVCGINITEVGFKAVKIEPHLGTLDWVKGSMPCKNDKISVDFTKNGSMGIKGKITIPQGLRATFVWKETEIQLKSGENNIDVD